MPTLHTFSNDHIQQAIALWDATDHVALSDADEPDRLAAFIQRNPDLSFVALENDEVVGTCLCGHDGRRGYIHHLAVAPTHRRRGLGSQLLTRSLAALRTIGIDKCHALVFRANAHGELFWQPAGWERRDTLWVYSRLTTG